MLAVRQAGMGPLMRRQKAVLRFIDGCTPAGRVYTLCIAALIGANCIAVVLEVGGVAAVGT
jgi:hypothetical protein